MLNIPHKWVAMILAILVIVIATKGLEDKFMTAGHNRSDTSDSGSGNTTAGQSINPRESQSSEDAATRGTGEEEIFIGTPSAPTSNAHPESTTHEVPIGIPEDPEAFEALKRGAQRADSENTAGQVDQ